MINAWMIMQMNNRKYIQLQGPHDHFSSRLAALDLSCVAHVLSNDGRLVRYVCHENSFCSVTIVGFQGAVERGRYLATTLAIRSWYL